MSCFRISGFIFLAIPFYFLWNYFAPIYLTNLPAVYLAIPFWHCVGIFLLFGIVRTVLFPSFRGYRHWGRGHWGFYGHGRCRR